MGIQTYHSKYGKDFQMWLDRKGLQTFLTEMQTNASTVTVIIVNRANGFSQKL